MLAQVGPLASPRRHWVHRRQRAEARIFVAVDMSASMLGWMLSPFRMLPRRRRQDDGSVSAASVAFDKRVIFELATIAGSVVACRSWHQGAGCLRVHARVDMH
eukprot:scaffold144986_cov28-Tisochrysis_lutea.AAC.2